MRELPPADPFPIDALGGVLAPAARAIHDRVQAPQAICGQSVLAAATLTVQGHADVELPTGQKRPLTNFYLTIAATGERKTSVDAEALGPVRKREAALHEGYDAKRHEYQIRGWHGRRPGRQRLRTPSRKATVPRSNFSWINSGQRRSRPWLR